MDKVSRSRELCRDSSRAEKICWHLIRDRRINEVKFRRQHPIGPYFADFACISKKLVIEIDGEHMRFKPKEMHAEPPSWSATDGAS